MSKLKILYMVNLYAESRVLMNGKLDEVGNERRTKLSMPGAGNNNLDSNKGFVRCAKSPDQSYKHRWKPCTRSQTIRDARPRIMDKTPQAHTATSKTTKSQDIGPW